MNKVLEKFKYWSTDTRVLWIIFSLTIAASFYRGYGFSNNSYAIASWLVTYEAGLIKRGLIGTILQLEALSRLSGLSVPVLFFWITNALLVLVHILVFLVVIRMVSLNKLALLFIAYFLIGPLLRTQSVWIGNIDHLLAIMMIAITYCLIKEKFFMAAALSVSGVLIHEIIFAMTFPLFSFWILTRLAVEDGHKSEHFKKILLSILINIFVLAFIVLYHDSVASGNHASAYVSNMLMRQPEDNYNSGAIVEVYATSFRDWFLFQKGEFFGRILDPALILIVIIPVIIFLYLLFKRSEKSKNEIFLLCGGIALCYLPLAVLSIAWDVDRIWNLSTWVLFLMIWFQLETKSFRNIQSGGVALIIFIMSIPAFLIPQVRGNIEWDLLFLIYAPYIAWQFMYIAGLFYKNKENPDLRESQ